MKDKPEDTIKDDGNQKNTSSPRIDRKEAQPRSVFAFQISSENEITMTSSIAGAVIADQNLEMTNSSTQVAVAGADTNLYNSSAKIVVTGNTQKLHNSRAGIVKAGGDAEVRDSHIRVLAGSQLTARKSKIGVVLSRQAILEEGTQVTINTPQAAVIGAAFGAAFAVLNWLLRRNKS
jgi:hypothetical protein